jgi:hypothetical protein
VPFAVGIRHQVSAARAAGVEPWATTSLSTIGRFFAAWVRWGAYLEALAAPGSRRVNLDGSDGGEVDEARRAHALGVLA